MTPVVFDCNVVLAAIGWSGVSRLCLKLAAQRKIRIFVTEAILAEYEVVIPERLKAELPGLNPEPKLAWLRRSATLVAPAPLGKRRSRDPNDDPYLACALSAEAQYLVTYDRDLLELGTPFGVKMIRPAELLRRLKDSRSSPI